MSTDPIIASQPPADQSNSRLLQLPAEIRLVILRELLVHDGILYFRETYMRQANTPGLDAPRYTGSSAEPTRHALRLWREKYETKGYRLTPAILRTSQTLYQEGRSILYAENVPTITLNGPGCGIGHGGHCYDECPDKRGCWIAAPDEKSIASWYDDVFCSEAQNEGEAKALPRFSALHLEFQIQVFDKDLFREFRVMLDHLASLIADPSKTITMTFYHEPQDQIQYSSPEVSPAHFLQGFRIFRWKKFEITGKGENIYLRESTDNKYLEEATETSAIFTGQTPVYDPWRAATKLQGLAGFLGRSFADQQDPNAREEVKVLMRNIEDAAIEWNVPLFLELREQFLALFDREMSKDRAGIAGDNEAQDSTSPRGDYRARNISREVEVRTENSMRPPSAELYFSFRMHPVLKGINRFLWWYIRGDLGAYD